MEDFIEFPRCKGCHKILSGHLTEMHKFGSEGFSWGTAYICTFPSCKKYLERIFTPEWVRIENRGELG